MPKISDLPTDTAPDSADIIPFVDVTASRTESVTVANLAGSAPFTDQYAPINDPTFTGDVVVPDATADGEAVNKGQMDAADALKAPINNPTFTGNVQVPDANADGEAIAYDQSGWRLKDGTIDSGSTLTELTINGSAQARLYMARNSIDRFSLYTFATGNTLRLQNLDGSASVYLELVDDSEELRLGGPSVAVKVPAPTAANHAAQVTAIDAATGRLAIGGHEIGDTGNRNVTADLVNGWATVGSGALYLRRSGNMVTSSVFLTQLSAAAATDEVFYNIPTGFRPVAGVYNEVAVTGGSGGTPTLIRVAGTGLTDANTIRTVGTHVGNTVLRFTVSWVTSDAWPATLPGT